MVLDLKGFSRGLTKLRNLGGEGVQVTVGYHNLHPSNSMKKFLSSPTMMILPKVIRIDLTAFFDFNFYIIGVLCRTHELLWVGGGYIGLRNSVCSPYGMTQTFSQTTSTHLTHDLKYPKVFEKIPTFFQKNSQIDTMGSPHFSNSLGEISSPPGFQGAQLIPPVILKK